MRPQTPSRPHPANAPRRQAGIALLALLTLLTLWGLYLFVGQLSATQFERAREQDDAAVLAEAKAVLLTEATVRDLIPALEQAFEDTGYLRLPDLGAPYEGGAATEGSVPNLNFTGNAKDVTVIGKLPWKTLAMAVPLRDRYGECLWYVVSGRFKRAPATDALNWDTQGQIDVINASGNVIERNLAALLVAPGRALDGQNRALADAAYTDCGGNYDARNYLDSFNAADAISVEVNYFAGSAKNRFAPDTNSKRFVLADADHYNDRFVFITVDEIFDLLIRRSDFKAAITALLDDPDLRKQVETANPETVAVSSGAGKEKGTYNLSCGLIVNTNNRAFCKNWKEMLFLTERSLATALTVNGASCNRVLIFAGRRAAGQNRRIAVEKADKHNYLEGNNASSFSVPTATFPFFSGASAFTWRTASADIVRCLP